MLRKVANRSDIGEEQRLAVEADGKNLALFLVNGQVFATDDECPHAGCLLSEEGVVEGEEVECACHGSRFAIATGANLAPPAMEPLSVYPAQINGDEVFVDV